MVMRNLKEFPITKKEISSYLKTLENELPKNRYGDIRPVLLKEAIKIVEKSNYNMEI
jgi:hypothetical protein